MEKLKPTKQLAQNLKDLLKDIGENSVLFQIYTRIHSSEWQAFKNLEHSGCDIVLLNLKTNRIIKIEVKTRQSLYTTATSKNTEGKRQFNVTKNEYDEMDLLICFWFDYNSYFIVPKSDLGTNNANIKLTIKRNGEGGYGINDKFLDKWENLTSLLL
ncbi:DUF3883 domain-containing protein [Flavobacterium johnsoniae]|uniref:hypothetical protein n=1 Tax=Flavobacterium TaxID=237 RepID=UPI000DADFC4D|nr:MULTISPECIES: hypothetical protein [Flavobacterium]KAF2082069.1 hypothetical protein DMA14_06255 [Flavobacterium sharifuzzamanii]WJS96792.1 DUF3883 domain-containing protein [Flavobacterium johnsoniae]